MFNTNPTSLSSSDSYPSYGSKSKYQIKSVISIVNQDYAVQILGGYFKNNIGTKGVIYIDMKHASSGERVIIGGVLFEKNSGYIDSNVIYIRARGPPLSNVYAPISSSADAYCGGYLLQKNVF